MQGNALLALAAATLWGGADFSGGMGVGASGGKTGSAIRVVMLSHAASLSVLLAVILLRREPLPHGALLGWGLLAGFCGGISLTCFYTALSRGSMGVSAAVSGLLAAAIPAAVSMWGEGPPGLLKLAGFCLAAMAIWMVAATPAMVREQRSTMVLAIVAGIGFGVYFVALRMANPLGVFVPMVLARVGSLATCGVALGWLVAHGNAGGFRMSGRAVLWALSAGTLDTSGNLLFIGATRAGRLDVAAVLASLYPATTIALAGWVQKEKLARRQWVGMVVAAAAVVMITV